jgi:hypothetical protein
MLTERPSAARRRNEVFLTLSQVEVKGETVVLTKTTWHSFVHHGETKRHRRGAPRLGGSSLYDDHYSVS